MPRVKSPNFYALLLLIPLFLPAPALGQAAIHETSSEPETREHTWWRYKMTSRIGLGTAFVDINGSRDKYRTDYNQLPGFVLGEFYLGLEGRDTDTPWVDYLKLNLSGFGDAMPYQQASLNFGKSGRYDFRGTFRKQEYFFSVPSFALGTHGEDSARRITDLNLKIYAHRKLTLDLGYFRNTNYGTSYGSAFEFQRLFELRDPRRSVSQDFRVGITVNHGPLMVSAVQNFREYKDDPEASDNRTVDGAGSPPRLASTVPVRMSIPSTMLTVRYAPSDRFEIGGRYRFSDGRADTGRSEFLALKISQGITLERLLRGASRSDRPEHEVEFDGSLQLTDFLVFSGTFEGEFFEIDGNSSLTTRFGSVVPGAGPLEITGEQSTFFRKTLIRARPQMECILGPRVSLIGGYLFSQREIETETLRKGDITVSHLGFAGATVRPYANARFTVQHESGTANDAFTRIEPREVRRWRLTSHLPIAPGFAVAPHFLISDRENTDGGAFRSDQRQGGVELTFHNPGRGILAAAGYTLFELDTQTDIRFFLLGSPVSEVSRYRTHLHYYHARAFFPIGSRATVNFGYRGLRDPDGSSFPLNRDQGEAGISLRTGTNLVWDLRWQHVSYNERLSSLQDYSANVLGLTLRWGF